MNLFRIHNPLARLRLRLLVEVEVKRIHFLPVHFVELVPFSQGNRILTVLAIRTLHGIQHIFKREQGVEQVRQEALVVYLVSHVNVCVHTASLLNTVLALPQSLARFSHVLSKHSTLARRQSNLNSVCQATIATYSHMIVQDWRIILNLTFKLDFKFHRGGTLHTK